MTKFVNATYLRLLLILVTVAAFCSQATARETLITSASQLSSNCVKAGEDVKYLADNDSTTTYHTPENIPSGGAYIEVKLNTPLQMSDDEVLVVYLRRCKSHDSNHPTAFRVLGSTDGGATFNTNPLFYSYFPYRGKNTEEYSSRIQIDSSLRNKAYTHLRFYVTANNSRSQDASGNRHMGFSEFQIYKLDKREYYTGTKVDRFHDITDYQFDFQDYIFENTMGVVDNANHQGSTDIASWSNWSQWQSNGGKWTKDTQFLLDNGVEMPDYSFIEPDEDNRLAPGQKRQAAHVSEHIIYAVPGDIVPLYPFYQMGDQENRHMWSYKETLSHWYDYTTGGRLIYDDGVERIDMLDFLTDPSKMHRSDKYGYYGSTGLLGKSDNNSKYIRIYSPEDFIRFIYRVNYKKENTLDAYIMVDELDFAGYGIQEPIASSTWYNKGYAGTIHGNGCIIKNLHTLSIKDGSGKYLDGGFIAYADDGCTIENLIFDSTCTFEGGRHYAGLVGILNYPATAIKGLTLRNIDTNAYIYCRSENIASDYIYTGALVGNNPNRARFTFENIHVGGIVDSKQLDGKHIWGSALGAGLMVDKDPPTGALKCIIKNVYVDTDVKNVANGNATHYLYRSQPRLNDYFDNVYSIKKGNDANVTLMTSSEVNTSAFLAKLNKNGVCFQAGATHPVPVMSKVDSPKDDLDNYKHNADGSETAEIRAIRKYGTIGTFFCPRNTNLSSGQQESLPFKDGESEFVIAADFSQTFDSKYNVDLNNRVIKEPTVAFRHIFRIRDGVQFAEHFSGSPTKNRDYNRKNRHRVSARAGVPFQIRLDAPLPDVTGAPTNFYYKFADDDYRRVDMVIQSPRVLDAVTRKPVADAPVFKFTESFDANDFRYTGSGTKQVIYYAFGGGKYNRMLSCDAPKAGKYIVQVIGAYKDMTDNSIKPITAFGGAEGSETDQLVVMEYEIEFLEENANGAHLILEKQLYGSDNKYEYARPEQLVADHRAPKSSVTFDEYTSLESLTNAADYLRGYGKKRSFKWPVKWDSSNYAFGYENTINLKTEYNMYMLSSHSDMTPYHGAVTNKNSDINHGEGPGLFDRLFYDSRREGYEGEQTHGYFYYINAASDPGVMTRLHINDLCLGSTVYVSAWIAEFSGGDETANVVFNFVAVTAKGERVKVHSFVTGYVNELRGNWMNAFYSFVPDLSSLAIADDDHILYYEIELDNNCKNSHGADYAVDDINVYISTPELFASQQSNVCDANVTSAKVKIWSPFQSLLSVLGIQESTGDEESHPVKVYYTFINKANFDAIYEANGGDKNENAGEIAYNSENVVLNYDYDGTGKTQSYGTLTFSSRFSENTPYDPDAGIMTKGCAETIDGRQMIVFNSVPSDDNLIADKDYYIVMHVALDGEEFIPDWATFNFKQSCAKFDTFNVKKAFDIKVNGEVETVSEFMRCCENQSPVIQVNLKGIDPATGHIVVAEKNAYFDWWNGDIDDYNNVAKDGMELWKVLDIFRSVYPEADRLDDVKPNVNLGFTSKMIDWIRELITEVPEGYEAPRLTLHKSSFIFPPLKIRENEESSLYYILAIPIAQNVENDKVLGDVRICAAPTQVGIMVIHKSPLMSHGFADKGIAYPASMHDVPLRVGLKQLAKVTISEGADTAGVATLNIPVRHVETKGDPNISSMRLIADDNLIYLAATNDPAYKDLGTIGDDGEEIADLLCVGEIVRLKASKNQSDNYFDVVFYDSFKFREGYEYSLRFQYEENDPNAPETPDPNQPTCNGEDIFTIRVVPEYLKWVGDDNLNWNNDANWRRVSSSELLYSSADKDVDAWKENVTDMEDSRKNTLAYAPLDFTNVLLPKNCNAPRLYDVETVNLTDYFPEVGAPVLWSENPNVNSAYAPTHNIQYDMVAFEGGDNLGCRPWYAHTCRDIHFFSGANIYSQQYLEYRKASVDIEMAHTRWYTLSSPLQETFAGDFYLPSKDARQQSGVFRDILFDKDINNRFNPAVYQRGWNKSSAIVYSLEEGKSSNVALKADWSRVFNDVTEQYGGGTGFSIKSDVSGITANNGKVLFRLPKSDVDYDYYTQSGATDWKSDHISRTGLSSRLNEGTGVITASAQVGSEYYLVGNPYMMPMDMKAFLLDEENAKRIEPIYWILTEDGQGAAIFDETDGMCGTATGVVAPFQGFFVKIKPRTADFNPTVDTADTSTLSLRYNPAMMYLADDTATPLRAPRIEDISREISITVADTDGEKSAAIIRLMPQASPAFSFAEDVAMLSHSDLDLPGIYTIAGNMAAAINTLPEINNVQLGCISPYNDKLAVTFSGIPTDEDLVLVDRVEKSCIELYNDLTLNIVANAPGRYYLSHASVDEIIDAPLQCNVTDNIVLVTRPGASSIEARVYDVAGRALLQRHSNGEDISISLPAGIYLIEALSGEEKCQLKVVIR